MKALCTKYLCTRSLCRNLFSSISSPQYLFDIHTTIKAEHDDSFYCSQGFGNFSGMITNHYSISNAPNGGYLTFMAISAARKCIPFHDPFAVTVYFVNKAVENCEATFHTVVLNVSKSTATVEVSLTQQGKLRLKMIGTFGKLSNMRGVTKFYDPCPPLAPIEECIDATKLIRQYAGDSLSISKTYDLLVPKNDPFATSILSQNISLDNMASTSGYVRFSDGRPLCLHSLAFFGDALLPPVCNIVATTWVPTLEYTIHFWGSPNETAPPKDTVHDSHHNKSLVHDKQLITNSSEISSWLRVYFKTPQVKNGIVSEDGELWSYDGLTLYAKIRQMARVLTPSK